MKKLLFIMMLCGTSWMANATTHYASPTGTAAYIVSSETNPMTLEFAYFSCAAGDSLLLEGTFTLTQNLYVALSDLYIGEYGSGATLQGNYDNTTAGFPLITLRYPTDVTVENLTFANHFGNDSRGILVWGSGDNILIKNNTFTNIGWNTDATAIAGSAEGANAIFILGNVNSGSLTNVQILGNAVTNCITGRNESITVIGNVDGFTIADNYISDVTNIGIDAAGHFSWVADYDTGVSLNDALNQARNGVIRNNTVIRAISPIATSAGLYCDGCRDVVFERNIVEECGAGMSIGCEVGGGKTASNVTVINNIFKNNEESGLFIGSLASEESAQGASSVDDCVVRNNTFFRNCRNDGNGTGNDYEVFIQNSNNNVFKNNILSMLNTAQGIVAAGTSEVVNFDMDYNLFYRPNSSEANLVISSATSTLTGNANSQYGNPGLSGIVTNTMNISTTGRAANAGDPSTSLVSGELDRDGGVRIKGGRIDIGAQESSSNQTPPTPNTEFVSSIVHMTKRNASGFAIDGNNGGVDGQDVYLWSEDATNVNQQWIEIDRGNGYYSYQKNNTNFCLDGGIGGADGQNVYLWTCGDTNQNQHWRKVSLSGYYRLEKRNASGFSIDGNHGGIDGQNLYLWTSSDTNPNQQWDFGSVSARVATEAVALVEELDASAFNLYPNPASNLINITGIEEGQSVKIYNSLGSFVMQSFDSEVDVSSLRAGIYFIKVQNETLRFVKK